MGAEFIECITKKDLELLNAFINEKNPDLNAEDGGATIPLNMAVHVGNIDVFYYLVEQGCDISLRQKGLAYGFDLASRLPARTGSAFLYVI